MVGFVLLLTLLIMAVTFRSIPIAIVSTLLNLGSVGVAFGMLALVFQHGWAEGLLDFTNPGFVIDWIPVFVLVVLVGLSMDYHVFVVSRIREHVLAGMTTREAVELARPRHRRRDHLRGRGDDLGVRDLRDAEHAGDEDDGRRPVGRHPLRRHARAAGHAARDPGAPGRARLVAGAARRASRHLPADQPADEAAYELVR